jgi:phage recombination protein Bet
VGVFIHQREHDMTSLQIAEKPQRVSLLAKVASRYGVEPTKMMTTLKATAFKSQTPASDEQMMALLIVADQYGLNPWTKEVYAFPDKGGIVPVVGVDGWSRIVNEHPQFDGMTLTLSDDGAACTCVMYRKDRAHPISVTEYMAECKRGTQPWTSHPRRMLRHKAMVQCARMAFGFAGIYDPDEAERIAKDMGDADEVTPPKQAGIAKVRAVLSKAKPADTIDMETGEVNAPAPETEQRTYAQCADSILEAADAAAGQTALNAALKFIPPEFADELQAVYANRWQ